MWAVEWLNLFLFAGRGRVLEGRERWDDLFGLRLSLGRVLLLQFLLFGCKFGGLICAGLLIRLWNGQLAMNHINTRRKGS